MTAEPLSTPQLTRAFCTAAATRLIFHPESVDEAEFIVQSLNNLGFKYYKPEYAQLLGSSVGGTIYLDTDKTIMVSSGNSLDGTACSIEGFDQFFLPQGIQIGEPRLTPEDCRQKTLIFYPRTAGESRGLMQALFKAGVTMEGSQAKATIMTARPILQGVVVRGGRLDFGPTPEDLRDGTICAAADLGVASTVNLSPEQATMIATFNEITARISQLASRVEAIEKEIVPRQIDKPEMPARAGLKNRP